jgi:hypothetical protein
LPAGKVQNDRHFSPSADTQEPSGPQPPVFITDMLNYEVLFEVEPHHQFVPHEPDSSIPGALSTLLSSNHPSGHQVQVGTAKKPSIARKAHNLSPKLHPEKRSRAEQFST